MSNSHIANDRNTDLKHGQNDRDCSPTDTGHALTEKSDSKQVNAEYDAQVGPANYMRRRGAIDLGREPRAFHPRRNAITPSVPRQTRPRRNAIDYGRPQIPDIEDFEMVQSAMGHDLPHQGNQNPPMCSEENQNPKERSTGHTDRIADENDNFVHGGLTRAKRLPVDLPTGNAQYIYYGPHRPRRGSKSEPKRR